MHTIYLKELFKISKHKNIPLEIIIYIYKILISDNLEHYKNKIVKNCIHSENIIKMINLENTIKYSSIDEIGIWENINSDKDFNILDRNKRDILLSQIRLLGEKEYLFTEKIDKEDIIIDYQEAPLKLKIKYLNTSAIYETLNDYIDFKGIGEYGDMDGWPKLIIDRTGDSRYL